MDIQSGCTPKQKQNYEFIKILRSREDRDFCKFCEALIDHDAEAVQNLGKILKSKLQTTKAVQNLAKISNSNLQNIASSGKINVYISLMILNGGINELTP